MDWQQEDILKLLFALIIGGLIGAEREYRNKSAGFRTLMLITIGSALFTIISSKMTSPNQDRIASTIITGIGFLGAGAIFKDENNVRGLTTAATIWAAAALGMCVGWGYYPIAIVGTLLVVFVLTSLLWLEQKIDERNRVRKYKIVCNFKQQTLHHYERLFKEMGLKPVRGTQSRTGYQIIGNWTVIGSEKNHERATTKLLADPDIKEFDF